MIASIVAIALGLLLWFCIVFTMVTPFVCSLPDEFWSRTDSPLPSVIALFATAFFLLFILNAMIFYSGKKDASFKEALVTGSGAIANAFLIVTLALILLTLLQSNNDSRVSYEEKIATPYSSNNRCLQLEPFLGKWKIIKNTEVESVFKDYILFSRNKTITTNNAQLNVGRAYVDFLDKYYVPENFVYSIIPDLFNDSKSVKGNLGFDYCVFYDKYCDWYDVNYYFEMTDEKLILVKTDFIYTNNGRSFVVDGEYILLQRMAE